MDLFLKSLFAQILILLASVLPASSAALWHTSPELGGTCDPLLRILATPDQAESPQPTIRNATAGTVFRPGDWVVANAITNRNETVAEILTGPGGAFLAESGPESFVVLIDDQGVRYLIGGGQRGVFYATQWAEDETRLQNRVVPNGAVTNLQASPYFEWRAAEVGGGPSPEAISNPRPADYDWDQYAKDLTRMQINLSPGVIQGEIVPDRALIPFGLRKIVHLPGLPFDDTQLREWRNAEADNLTAYEDLSGQIPPLMGPSPQTAFGREQLKTGFMKYLQEHKTAAFAVLHGSEWTRVPGEDCYPSMSPAKRVVEYASFVAGVLKEVAPQATLLLATKGLTAEEAEELIQALPGNLGLYLQEPTVTVLDEAPLNHQAALQISSWDADWTRVLDKALGRCGSRCFVVSGIGDTDRYTNPAVGLSTPHLAFSKLRRLQEKNVSSLVIGSGGLTPWVYSANRTVLRVLTWDTETDLTGVLDRVAKLDFGPLADLVQSSWRDFFHAGTYLKVFSEHQALTDLVRPGEDLLTGQFLPTELWQNSWFQDSSVAIPYLRESLPSAIGHWRAGVERLTTEAPDLENTDYDVVRRFRETQFWSRFYQLCLESQLSTVRLACLYKWFPPNEVNPDSSPAATAFEAVASDELENLRNWVNLLQAAPVQEIYLDSRPYSLIEFSRKLEQRAYRLQSQTLE